jgi:hypothetical protein
MTEESTTPDLVELSRRQFAAGNRHDADAVLSNCVPDAVWDLSDAGMGVSWAWPRFAPSLRTGGVPGEIP